MFLVHTPSPSRLLKPVAALVLAAIGLAAIASDPAPDPTKPQPVEPTGRHNVCKIDDLLYSGSSPDSDASFAELARAGVKVIISVDGSKPLTDLARKHGIRYVHLPIGYDGVPQRRIAELI